MAVDSIEAEAFALEVERFYASLISFAASNQRMAPVPVVRPGMKAAASASTPVHEPSLGGRLFYAGELDAEARALIVAANIAGAATLAASSDAEARKQAMRDGVVDFLVSTLDEALRILKNEVRKLEPVAVCVALAPEMVEREMSERGVLPDLQRPINFTLPMESKAVLLWRALSHPVLWLPKIDGIAAECLQQNMVARGPDIGTWESARRWLRLSPRYLGRLAQGARVLRCGEYMVVDLRERVRAAVDEGRIGCSVEVQLMRQGSVERQVFAPKLA